MLDHPPRRPHRDPRSSAARPLVGGAVLPAAILIPATILLPAGTAAADFTTVSIQDLGDLGIGVPTRIVRVEFDDPDDRVLAVDGSIEPLTVQSLDGSPFVWTPSPSCAPPCGSTCAPWNTLLGFPDQCDETAFSPGSAGPWDPLADPLGYADDGGYFDANPATALDGGSVAIARLTVGDFLMTGTVTYADADGGIVQVPFEIASAPTPGCPSCGGSGALNQVLSGSLVGPPSGDDWSWRIISPAGDFLPVGPVTVPGITPGVAADDLDADGDWDAFDVALRFAGSINAEAAARGCLAGELQAQAVPFGSLTILSVATACDFELWVGDPADPSVPSCNVAATGCTFNPAIEALPLPGIDCNGNGIDDLVDIETGVSGDANGDGVPDECACPADLGGDGEVGLADLIEVLAAWGSLDAAADIDGDGLVGLGDLLLVLSAWGPC